MSLNKPFNANEIHGLDFGEMIMASQSKAKFVDWKEIRVFSVAKSGMYIAFRVGSKKIVQIVCHETDEHETPRFERMALSEDANPIEGLTTTMIWKYKHGNDIGLYTTNLTSLPNRQSWALRLHVWLALIVFFRP